MIDSLNTACRSCGAGRRMSMIDYDGRPGHPPDRTLCRDRRSRRDAPLGTRSSSPLDRRRAGVSGRSAGAARVRQRAQMDPVRLLPTGAPVPIPAQQPGYHKRLRAAAPLLAAAISHVARVNPSWCDDLRLIDATPLPCGTSRETVKRSDIAPTDATNPSATAAWAGSGSGSSPSTTPSKASWAWNATADAPPTGCSPESPSDCSPWPQRSGTTGTPTLPTSAASSPTTTDPPASRNQSSKRPTPASRQGVGRFGSSGSDAELTAYRVE